MLDRGVAAENDHARAIFAVRKRINESASPSPPTLSSMLMAKITFGKSWGRTDMRRNARSDSESGESAETTKITASARNRYSWTF